MNSVALEFRPEFLPSLEIPKINPIPAEIHRPFWSVMIPTYNRPAYLEEALQSILRQDPGPEQMQIMVVDNCSTVGDIEAVVQRVGRGRVEYFRQESNLGHFLNGLTCLQRSRGQWVHILHDDDMVLPDFYKAYEGLIQRHPEASLLIGPSIHMDESYRATQMSTILENVDGEVLDFQLKQAIWNQVATPSAVVPRWVYEQVGGFSRNLTWGNDWEMWFRAGGVGRVATTTFPRVVYRTHPASDHMEQLISGWSLIESLKIIDHLCSRLSDEQRSRQPRRYRDLSIALVYYSQYLRKAQKHKESLRSIRSAVRLNPSLWNILHLGSALRRYPWTGGRFERALAEISRLIGARGTGRPKSNGDVSLPMKGQGV